MKKIDFLVVGLIRDNEKKLQETVAQICKFLYGFTFDFYIVESDSQKIPKINFNTDIAGLNELKIISLGDLSNKYPNRIERLAFCRNHYLEYFRNNCRKYTYIMVVDFDGIVNNLYNSKMLDIFKRLQDLGVVWSAIFPNQIPFYYDIYALRCNNWVNDNAWGSVYSGEISNRGTSKWLNIYSKMYMLPTNLDYIEVQSAFGGIGIYRASSIKLESTYGFYQENNFDVCEHVGFNLGIEGKKFIITNWISSVGKNEHIMARCNISIRTTLYIFLISLRFNVSKIFRDIA